MLDPQDIHKIANLIESSEKRLERKIKDSENRVKEEIKQEIKVSEHNILAEVGSFNETSVFTQIDDKADKNTVLRIDKKTDAINERVNNLENLPTIAHELKKKKV